MFAHLGRKRLLCLSSVFISFISVALVAVQAQAMKVAQSKGNKALVTLESGDSPAVGDLYFVMINGKKLGLIEISQVKGKRAIAVVKKGRADVGSELSFAKAGGGGGGGGSSKQARRGKSGRRGGGGSGLSSIYFGALVGMNSATQTVKVNNATSSISMAGNGFSLKAFGDMTLTGGLGVVARAGVETLALTGNATISGATRAFKTDIMYVTGDLLIRYKFDLGSFSPYVSGGMGLHMPMSKQSDALGDVPMMTVIFANGGVNYQLSQNLYLTGLVEYGLFPPSGDVSTSFLAFRGGAAMHF
jgi:hypothetical protein